MQARAGAQRCVAATSPCREERAGQAQQFRTSCDDVSAGMPDWLEPMAATLTQERFTGPDWVFERKFDGIRLLAYKHGSDVQLYSRNRRPQDLPAVAAAVA